MNLLQGSKFTNLAAGRNDFSVPDLPDHLNLHCVHTATTAARGYLCGCALGQFTATPYW